MPYVIEPSAGLTRSLMAFLVEAYTEDEAPNTKGGVDTRIVLRLDPRLAPVKAAVLPLSRKEELTGPARELAARLRRLWNVDYDDAGAVGRRYRRQDEVSTPWCITRLPLLVKLLEAGDDDAQGIPPGIDTPLPRARRLAAACSSRSLATSLLRFCASAE